MFPAALIMSCDSLLKRLNSRCCWRSLWSACRWGWFWYHCESIVSIPLCQYPFWINSIVSIPFETIVQKKIKKHRETWKIMSSTEQTRHASTSPRHAIHFSSILFSNPWLLQFYLFFVQPGNPNTIQYLIPGRTTNVELLKQVKNWQSPSRDPWSNCLINSRETTKGQTNCYSGREKDNSKTICGQRG